MLNLFNTCKSRKKAIGMLSLIVTIMLSACSKEDTIIAPEKVKIEQYSPSRVSVIEYDSSSTLKSVSKFPIGIATGSWLERKSPKGFAMLNSEFSSKTVYTYMDIETSKGKFNFGEADYWVKWAANRNVRLYGHCLVYHQGAPDWLLNFSGTTQEFEDIVKNHVQTIVKRYKGKVKGWDVMNEVFSPTTGKIVMTPFRKRYSSDREFMGFAKRCFIWAHEADPDALLFYNDGNLHDVPQKLAAVVAFANELKASGVPIHGLANQMHISIATTDLEISNSLAQLANTGLLVHVSELDMRINPNKLPELTFTKDLFRQQGLRLKRLAEIYKSTVPVPQQFGITLWDISDADSWIVVQLKRVDAPCLFDGSFNKKDAYFGLLDGLKD